MKQYDGRFDEYEELYGDEDDYEPFNKVKKTKLRERVIKNRDNKRRKKKKVQDRD